MKPLSIVLIGFIALTISCKKDKTQSIPAVSLPDTSISRPTITGTTDTNKLLDVVITEYTGSTRETYTSSSLSYDSTYPDHAIVTLSFKDSTIKFEGSFTSETFKMDKANDYFRSDGYMFAVACNYDDSTLFLYYGAGRDSFKSTKTFNGRKKE